MSPSRLAQSFSTSCTKTTPESAIGIPEAMKIRLWALETRPFQASNQIKKAERTFFSRCTKQHHFPRDVVLLHDILRGHSSGYRSNGDEIVAASMSDSRKSICESS